MRTVSIVKRAWGRGDSVRPGWRPFAAPRWRSIAAASRSVPSPLSSGMYMVVPKVTGGA